MDFYKKNILIQTAVLLAVVNILFLVLGFAFYEDYESILASITYGNFGHLGFKDWYLDVHLLLLPLYAEINSLIPFTNVFGMVNILLNFSVLLFLAHTMIRVGKLLKIKNLQFFVPFLILIIGVENLIHLNSTRPTVIFTITLILSIIIDKKENKPNSYASWFCLIILCFIFCLIRQDAVLLTSIFLLIISAQLKIFDPKILFIVLFSILSFTAYNFIINQSDNEAFKVFYYKEFDLMERANFNRDKLSDLEQLELYAIREFHIIDNNNLTMEFVNNITEQNKDGYKNLFNGIGIQQYINTLKNSVDYFIKLKYHILFLLFIGLLQITRISSHKIRDSLILFSIVILPITACLYVVTPERFLNPYYTLFIFAYLFLNLSTIKNTKVVYSSLLLFFTITSINHTLTIVEYNSFAKRNKRNLEKIKTLETKHNADLVIDFMYLDHFIPIQVFQNKPDIESSFLNMGFFNSFYFFKDIWEQNCQGEADNLNKKFKCMSNNGISFASNENRMDFYKLLLQEKYKSNISFQKIDSINDRVNIYSITME